MKEYESVHSEIYLQLKLGFVFLQNWTVNRWVFIRQLFISDENIRFYTSRWNLLLDFHLTSKKEMSPQNRLFLMYLMAIFYIFAGVMHFVNPDFYLSMMPRYLPFHLQLVYLSGLVEILCGLLLFSRKTQVFGAWLTIALLIAVCKWILKSNFSFEQFSAIQLDPANIQMTQNYWSEDKPGKFVTLLRLPFQFVFIYWAYQYTTPLERQKSNWLFVNRFDKEQNSFWFFYLKKKKIWFSYGFIFTLWLVFLNFNNPFRYRLGNDSMKEIRQFIEIIEPFAFWSRWPLTKVCIASSSELNGPCMISTDILCFRGIFSGKRCPWLCI